MSLEVVKHISRFDFRQNGYILSKNGEALIIDPGDAPEIFKSKLKKKGLTLLAILATHGHIDHVYGAAKLCEYYSVPFIMNGQDQAWLDAVEPMCHQFNIDYIGTAKIDKNILKDTELKIGDFDLKIIHTPGHTPGSVCYLFDDILFSGDTLFYRSVGRTDLPRSDGNLLRRSIVEKLFVLPKDTKVYPGHMNSTTIKEEIDHNPFIIL
ncbi:MAG: MBL fold metallo-hydrolase [Candidatus Marinimicrobia bacterium]|nr:MBL fold metallo-hydrolase [Candidatus Neomarinimicrobiota bacterium]